MKNSIYILVIFLLWTAALRAEVAIVVHPDNTANITSKDISQLYLGKTKKFSDGSNAVPIGQKTMSGITNHFNEKVLNRTQMQVRAFWSRQVFSGKGTPPQIVPNDEEVIRLISTNPNLIGYIDSSKVSEKVKVVLTK